MRHLVIDLSPSLSRRPVQRTVVGVGALVGVATILVASPVLLLGREDTPGLLVDGTPGPAAGVPHRRVTSQHSTGCAEYPQTQTRLVLAQAISPNRL